MDKFIKTTFGAITQPYIIATLAKNTTRVLALLMFYETRKNPKRERMSATGGYYTVKSTTSRMDDPYAHALDYIFPLTGILLFSLPTDNMSCS